MWSWIWHTFFFDPVYNALVFFIDIVPGGDVGVAIILTVLLVKTLLLPISIKAVKTQKIMREIEPKLKEIKEQYKDDRQAQAQAMMEVYRDAGMNPLASVALIFIQIPIVIALYFSVYSGGGVALPEINSALLYSFVPNPGDLISMNFLGLVDITERSILLALLAGITMFFQMKLTLPPLKPREEGKAPDIKDEFMRNMQVQMKYVMPVIITVVAYTLSASIALYFFVSNLTAIAQEFYVKRHR
jgi:YidC/Oxa1 family membrane protein insertase